MAAENIILSSAWIACNAPTGKTMLPGGAAVSRGLTRISFPPRRSHSNRTVGTPVPAPNSMTASRLPASSPSQSR